jgi:hypothetical protein
MKHERLPPRVQNAERAELDAELAAPNVEQSLAGTAEQGVVENARSPQGEDVQLLRNGENDVKVRNRKNFLAAILQPLRASVGLATGAVPVAARMPDDMLEPAAIALLPLTAEGLGTASGERAESFALLTAGRMCGQILLARGANDRAQIDAGHNCRRQS